MPDEILAIIIILIASGTAITILKTILGFQERTRFGRTEKSSKRTGTKSGSKKSTGDASLTTSELEAMVARAAEGAVRPMLEDLEAMEERLDAMESRMGGGQLDLEDAFDEEREPRPTTKTVGTRVQ
jgi:hypothetical protein